MLQWQGVSQALFNALYVIFPIIVNFPIRCRCVNYSVTKAIIHRKKTIYCFMVLEKDFINKRHFLWYCTDILYLIILSVSTFRVSLAFIYQLYDPILRLYILKHHLTWCISCHIIFMWLITVNYIFSLNQIFAFFI